MKTFLLHSFLLINCWYLAIRYGFYVPHDTQEIGSGNLFDVSFRVTPFSHFVEDYRHLGDVFQPFRSHIDSVKIGAYSDMVNPGDTYRMVDMIDNRLV